MRLSIQIFRKDVERLWPAILLTLALLAYWTFQEATYSFREMAGPPQGDWLNLALPFAWGLLLALAVNEDALAGDRQFWVALPCGWKTLLSAKAMFAAAFVHAPYFVATAVILAARGFTPAAHVPHLFWKQLVLLALVLPAFGAAALVKNLGQFALLALTVTSAFVLTNSRSNYALINTMSWDVRGRLALAILCTGAVAVIVLQFLSRRTLRSGITGLTAALAALAVYTQLPRGTSAEISAALRRSDASLSIGVASRDEDRSNAYSGQRTVLVPIEIEGLPDGMNARFDQISLELTTSRGNRYDMERDSVADGAKRSRLDATVIWNSPIAFNWQNLRFNDTQLWSRFRGSPVTIHGRVLATLLRPGATRDLGPGAQADIEGAGRCVNYVNGEGESPAHQRMTLVCESPEVPSQNFAASWRRNGAQGRGAYLREHAFYGDIVFPADPWLSPLHRGTFVIGGTNTATIAVTPQTDLGRVLIDYTIPDIDLNRFTLKDRTNGEGRQ